jgi:transposase InsO family protein
VKIPPRAPRANAYAERWVRTVRSECLDWTLVWNERQLHRVLAEYLRHYNTVGPHRSLDLQAPRSTRRTLVKQSGRESPVHRVDRLNGVIHEYPALEWSKRRSLRSSQTHVLAAVTGTPRLICSGRSVLGQRTAES